MPKYKTAIFVHGCFWHYHKDCREGRILSTNSKFWKEKLQRNIAKDKANIKKLKKNGWTVFVIWECEIEKQIKTIIDKIKYEIRCYNKCSLAKELEKL